MSRPFLTAHWERLLMLNYKVDPDLIMNLVPEGTEPDLHKGNCFISLVGFMFLDTRVKGMAIPFHSAFEEINLRFYVKRRVNGEERRGVVFIREIVPKPSVTFVANTFFGERYITRKMMHSWVTREKDMITAYGFRNKKRQNIFSCRSSRKLRAGLTEEEKFISEHYFGYTSGRHGTREYEVAHVPWKVYDVLDHRADVDFGAVYGERFSRLSAIAPSSVLLAEGSAVRVSGARRI